MVVRTVAEWTKNIQMKENFRMIFVQLPSIHTDYTVADIDTFKTISGSIK